MKTVGNFHFLVCRNLYKGSYTLFTSPQSAVDVTTAGVGVDAGVLCAAREAAAGTGGEQYAPLTLRPALARRLHPLSRAPAPRWRAAFPPPLCAGAAAIVFLGVWDRGA